MEHLIFPEALYRIKEANINYYTMPFIHPRRCMTEHDFIYVLDGKWKIGQENEEYELVKDSLLILRGGCEHYGISPCLAGTKTMYFHVSGECPISGEDAYSVRLFYPQCNEKIKKRFSDVVHAYLGGNTRKANIYFSLLLCELEEYSSYTEDTSVAKKIKTHIHENPEVFFSNAHLAALANVSVKTAENKFKAMYGVSIHQYILNFKIKEAISYFEVFPEITIKEIAHNLGFFDEYHFSKMFKKITGKSPRAWKTSTKGT